MMNSSVETILNLPGISNLLGVSTTSNAWANLGSNNEAASLINAVVQGCYF
jgi:hypothetical protein